MILADPQLGQEMYDLVKELFPLPRFLAGEAVRQTLCRIQQELPDLTLHEVPTGTQCFDWVVPEEWHCKEAYLVDPTGRRFADFSEHNLHLVGYSTFIRTELDLQDLLPHIHSLPEQPSAIPYVTSYYTKRWGFCLTQEEKEALKPGKYQVVIDTEFIQGSITYGELLIPSTTGSKEEIFLSTYVCHPSMANNELSGPVVTTWLAKWILSLPQRRYAYRIIFIPETIGSLAYLSRHVEELKAVVQAGFNITCVGDDHCYSYLPSRYGDQLADRAALHVLRHHAPGFKRYSYLDRGSDERQYCAPGIDLPIASILRSKFSEYPEYHTSLDDLNFISPDGLLGAYEALRLSLFCLEHNHVWKNTILGEPQLGKRGLYPTLSVKNSSLEVQSMMDLLAYADGSNDLLAIAEAINQPVWELVEHVEKFQAHGLLNLVSELRE